jgi:two-component system, LytTR family, response regulator AgrA
MGENKVLNFVLCDDNLNIVKKLKEMLEILFIKNDIDAKIGFITDNPLEVISYEEENNIDVLILDINLNSNISGIDLAKQIRKSNKKVYLIFSTGHLEYSLLAYSVKTFDYLPKPLTIERLEVTLNRLLDDINSGSNKRFIKINSKTVIDEKEINYIKKDGMKLIFCTNLNKEYEAYSSFSKIENTLPSNFIRCHKSYIVNTNNIQNINTNNNIITFNSNIICDIGPKYKSNLMEVFKHGNISNNLDSINK